MKKRQLIATLACLLVGMAGFAGAYTMEQSDQNQSQQQAEISTTELSQVSGLIEPETEDNSEEESDAGTGDDIAKSSSGSDATDDVQTVTVDSLDGTGTGENDDAGDDSDAAVTNADASAGSDTDASGSGNTDAAASNADTASSDADSTVASAASADGTDVSAVNADSADTDSSSDEEDESEDDSTEDDAETVDADAVHFAAELRWPLEAGSVILNYSMDHMVYFETLEQYQYNPAMIISAEVGDKVYVVAEGMITDISTNEVTGLTVTEDLGDGYTVIYGQLENVNFAVGDTVERGHVLGYVAETTKYYSVEGTNLYFAMELDGEAINPLEYFAD